MSSSYIVGCLAQLYILSRPRLSEELYTRNDDSLVSVFKPQVERLIGSLCRHCQMEPDTVSASERMSLVGIISQGLEIGKISGMTLS